MQVVSSALPHKLFALAVHGVHLCPAKHALAPECRHRRYAPDTPPLLHRRVLPLEHRLDIISLNAEVTLLVPRTPCRALRFGICVPEKGLSLKEPIPTQKNTNTL